MAEPINSTVEPPDITGVINQQFFIEPQGGPKHPINYLDAFPESLYNKSLDSNLVAIMYTLLGPAGVGGLKKNFLEARLAVEANGLRTTELDALYAEPFSFARLAFETYEDDTEGLLSNAKWEKIQESDASYKNRAINYLKAIRAGGTLLGLTLAAKSGLDHAVEVVENYRALYDKYSDDPLGIDFIGVTKSTEEVILLPRQERPQSSQQTLSILGNPLQGTFRLAIPMGANGEGGPQNTTITGLLQFNADFIEVREALEALSVVGSHNVVTEGGPLPGNPITVRFTGELADRPIPEILVVQNSLADFEEHLVEIEVEVGQVGVSADGETAIIPVEDWYYAQAAIDNIKPMTAIVTPGKAPGITKRQIPSASFADSEFIEVLRYVTGRRGLPWPPVDATHWIEPGIEHEGPVSLNAQQSHYVNFHNISTAVAYTEAALTDPDYATVLWPTVQDNYKDEHIGIYSPAQRALFPFLATFNTTTEEFKAVDGPVDPPEPLTTQAGAVPLVNGIYPVDYQTLTTISGAPSETAPFWSSLERPEGEDFLEIDLGKVQGVNFIVFEATKKPHDILVSYDLLDGAPARRFVPVTYVNEREASSVLSLHYDATHENNWSLVSLNVENALGSMIFTRFIRIEFIRRPGVFLEADGSFTPYSVEVRNLRIGRNVSP
jgi:hypothetical protein